MTIAQAMLEELANEAAVTRKMLRRVPEDKFGWQPHEKSMTLGRLASHIAEIPAWMKPIIDLDEMIFDIEAYQPPLYESAADILDAFDEAVAEAQAVLTDQDDEHMAQVWRMKMKGITVVEQPRAAVLRSMGINHMIHHRGQLSVYLRLTDVPLPSVYGPSADEQPQF